MTINAGVWIDHHKAVILLITDEGEDLRQITSDAHQTALVADGAGAKIAHARSDLVAEGKVERKVESFLDKYYDEVIACLQNADSIWILGPGKAKRELKKRIQGQKLKGNIARVETVDEMTDHEIAEHVRQLLCVATK
jgi:stalled ribosome rescue protein Dom34